VMKYATVTKMQTFTRAPIGHTHTDRNGHTWDHTANPGHVCQFCGATQYVQDRSPRMVTIQREVQVKVAAPPVQEPTSPPVKQFLTTRTASVPVTTIFQGYSVSSSNCANGQCGYPQAGRRQ
jgi:hypothetical protein